MKCEDVSKELIAYLDRRANSAERQDAEEHLLACERCRTRADEFRKLWAVLDEVPVQEPSFGFDARLRQRIAAEPKPTWFRWLVPQPRLAFSMALLLVLSVWIAGPLRDKSASGPTEDEKFQMIEHLDVLENYDLLSKSDVLAEVPSAPAPQPDDQQKQQAPDDGGGSL
jgi:anti-sigma factor RsiW